MWEHSADVIELPDQSAQATSSEAVRSLFNDFSYMPLPLGLSARAECCIGTELCAQDFDASHAVQLDPALLDRILASGKHVLLLNELRCWQTELNTLSGYVKSVKASQKVLEALLVRRDFEPRKEPWEDVEVNESGLCYKELKLTFLIPYSVP